MPDISETKPKTKLWLWLLGILLIWLALAFIEGKLIARMDRMVRADRAVFVDYIERLPNPIIFPFDEASRSFCEQPRVWGLWTYNVCLYKADYEGKPTASFPCSSPFFRVSYERPNPIALPNLPKWRQTKFILNTDKSICRENDLTEEF